MTGGKRFKMKSEKLLKEMKDMCNGLTIAEGREKADVTVITGLEVTLEDWQKISDADGDYYAVIYKEFPNNFFFSGSKLTELIDKFGDECKELVLRHEERIKTKSKRDFTPVTVIGYED